MLWFRVPPTIYFKYGCLPLALRELKGKKRALIVTDKPLCDLGWVKEVTDVLEEIDIEHDIFSDVRSEPKLSSINQGLAVLNTYQPDVIIAFGEVRPWMRPKSCG